MNDESSGRGSASNPASDRPAEVAQTGASRITTTEQIKDDERLLVAHFHRDAATLLDVLRGRTEAVGHLVEAFGPTDCREIRVELQTLTRLTFRLLGPQFADL